MLEQNMRLLYEKETCTHCTYFRLVWDLIPDQSKGFLYERDLYTVNILVLFETYTQHQTNALYTDNTLVIYSNSRLDQNTEFLYEWDLYTVNWLFSFTADY